MQWLLCIELEANDSTFKIIVRVYSGVTESWKCWVCAKDVIREAKIFPGFVSVD